MTDYLTSNAERRIYFNARFVRWGVRTGWRGAPITTALFDDVRDHDDNLVVNQVWFTVGRQIQSLHLQTGDRVSFMARVMAYRSAADGVTRGPEFCLKWPTRMHKTNSDRLLPLFAGV